MEKSALDTTALVLAIIGGLNWGLVGLFNYNLVMSLLGSWPVVERIVYTIVGLAALWCISLLSKN